MAQAATRFLKGSEYRFQKSKYIDRLKELEETPGVEGLVTVLTNQNVASVQCWRIKNNFYRSGIWKARSTKAGEVFATYVGPLA